MNAPALGFTVAISLLFFAFWRSMNAKLAQPSGALTSGDRDGDTDGEMAA